MRHLAQGFLDHPAIYFLASDSAWLLTVLNSPLMWSFCWREAVHGKDEALRFFSDFVQGIPVAPPADDARAWAEEAAERLVEIAKTEHEARRELLDWLRVEFGVEKPGQKLEDFAGLDADAFVAEVRKRRPKGAGWLMPAALKDLRAGYAEGATSVREGRAEAARLERRLSGLVNEAYGVTPEEVDLLWSTSPPRMPEF